MSDRLATSSGATARKRAFLNRFAGGWLFLSAMLAAVAVPAQSESPGEYDVKAVFLFNFARFVEWPSSSSAQTNSQIVIGILGNDPFGSALDRAVQDETIRDQPIVIRRARRIEDLPACHLLYINLPDSSRLPSVLASLKKRGVLTVGEGEAFTRLGGIIGFRTKQNRVRFLINLEAAESEGFRISAKLLKVADLAAKSE